jgi:hypothetical protein
MSTINVITTYTGRKIDPLDPNPDDINLLDICHSLSNLCRFVGHVREFYSVGEHSCRVHDILPPELKLKGILHDASEGYFCDLANPLKVTPEMSFFREVEKNLMNVIYTKFGLDTDEPEELHWADKTMGSTEQRELMPAGSLNGTYAPLDNYKIVPWSPVQAKYGMILRLEKLLGERITR